MSFGKGIVLKRIARDKRKLPPISAISGLNPQYSHHRMIREISFFSVPREEVSLYSDLILTTNN